PQGGRPHGGVELVRLRRPQRHDRRAPLRRLASSRITPGVRGNEQWAVGRLALALFAFLIVAALCGCASATARRDAPTRRPLTLAEVQWVGRLDRWYGYDQFPVQCGMRLASTVGGAPTARLAPYYLRSAAACGHFDHWEDAQWLRKPDAEKELRKGWAIIKRVDRDLSPLRPGMRRLPR